MARQDSHQLSDPAVVGGLFTEETDNEILVVFRVEDHELVLSIGDTQSYQLGRESKNDGIYTDIFATCQASSSLSGTPCLLSTPTGELGSSALLPQAEKNQGETTEVFWKSTVSRMRGNVTV